MITKIKGHEAGFKFNNFAIELLPQVKNATVTGSGFGVALIFCAYRGWCFARQLDEKLTFEDINDWIDESVNNPEIDAQIKQITEEFLTSPYWKKTQEGIKKNELQSEAA